MLRPVPEELPPRRIGAPKYVTRPCFSVTIGALGQYFTLNWAPPLLLIYSVVIRGMETNITTCIRAPLIWTLLLPLGGDSEITAGILGTPPPTCRKTKRATPRLVPLTTAKTHQLRRLVHLKWATPICERTGIHGVFRAGGGIMARSNFYSLVIRIRSAFGAVDWWTSLGLYDNSSRIMITL